MKLEDLKVGQYVRTKLGIGKIVNKVDDINDYYYNCWIADNKIGSYDNTPFSQLEYFVDNEVIKAGFNVIDVLEAEDYVNGYKVKEVNNNLNEHKGTCNCLDTYLWCVNDLGKFEEIVIFENEIKSIVTKEQFKQMSYKLGE